MKLTKRSLTGKAYLATVTDLAQRIRLEGAYAGLHEAADLQWWWRKDEAAFPEHQIIWFDPQDRAVACLLRDDAGTEWNNDFLYLPSAERVIGAAVIPEMVATIRDNNKVSTLTIRADDTSLQHTLVEAGFVQGTDVMLLTELVGDPARIDLAPDFVLTSRVDDPAPHHLSKRNGPEIARILCECSLYRPDLDLCIRDAGGRVAAYALFWMDDVTRVGLLEPLRTEAAFQRLGLARHLVAEGVARLRALGAQSIRVAYDPDNLAAARLYRHMGFEERITCVEYRRVPGA